MLKVLVPVGGLAVLLLLVGVVIAISESSGTTSPSTTPAADNTGPPPRTPLSPPPDGSKFDKFPLDSPEWKDIGGGLKIWDVKEGTGNPCPTLAERPGLIPVMHYTGWLLNGVEFDSSRPKNDPLRLPLSQLISGWKTGVPGMKPGGVRRLYIPPHLGYGPQGQGMIPPNATLVFEMELLEVK